MSKDWSNGLFDCLGDCGACIYVCCCPPCAAGEVYRDADLGSFAYGCASFCVLCWAHPCQTTAELREKRGIEGSCCAETCTWFCCYWCHATRELREVRGT
eukprot:1095310_1